MTAEFKIFIPPADCGVWTHPHFYTDLHPWTARTNRLLVPSVKLSTVGGRAFPVAGPTICNSLPDNVISTPSLSTFRQRLKTFVPGLVPDVAWWCNGRASDLRSRGREFDSRPGRCCVTTLGKLFTSSCLDGDTFRWYIESLNWVLLAFFASFPDIDPR